MRITIDIPDELLERAIRTRDLRARRAAVAMALEQVANKARREEFVRRLGTFNIGMTREELLRWRRMGCEHERSEDEHGGETRADDS